MYSTEQVKGVLFEFMIFPVSMHHCHPFSIFKTCPLTKMIILLSHHSLSTLCFSGLASGKRFSRIAILCILHWSVKLPQHFISIFYVLWTCWTMAPKSETIRTHVNLWNGVKTSRTQVFQQWANGNMQLHYANPLSAPIKIEKVVKKTEVIQVIIYWRCHFHWHCAGCWMFIWNIKKKNKKDGDIIKLHDLALTLQNTEFHTLHPNIHTLIAYKVTSIS